MIKPNTMCRQSEAGDEQRIAPGVRAEQRERAERHEADAHQRDHPHRKRAAGDHAGAVEQEPGPRQDRVEAGAHQHHGEQRADGDAAARSSVRSGGPSRRTPSCPPLRALRCIAHPPIESATIAAPSQVASHSAPVLPSRHRSRDQRHAAHDDPAPAGHRREGGGPLHRLADERQIVHRPGVQGRRLRRRGNALGRCHRVRITRGPYFSKYFMVQSTALAHPRSAMIRSAAL